MQTKNVLKSFKDAFRDNLFPYFSPEIQGRSEIESHFESSAPITQRALEAMSSEQRFPEVRSQISLTVPGPGTPEELTP